MESWVSFRHIYEIVGMYIYSRYIRIATATYRFYGPAQTPIHVRNAKTDGRSSNFTRPWLQASGLEQEFISIRTRH